MQDTKDVQGKLTKEDYNKIPVFFCKRCLSLRIVSLNSSVDYCDTCGSVDIGQASIEAWENKYKEKYNKSYINKDETRKYFYSREFKL